MRIARGNIRRRRYMMIDWLQRKGKERIIKLKYTHNKINLVSVYQ